MIMIFKDSTIRKITTRTIHKIPEDLRDTLLLNPDILEK